MICWVCRLYFSGLVCSVLSQDECRFKINYRRFCVCFRCLEKVILWSRLCLAKDEFRYYRYLEWLIYAGKLKWCDLSTSKIHQVEETVLVSILIFVHKINTAWNDDNMDHVLSCQLFLECCACEIFNSDISFTSTFSSTFITLVKSVQTSHQPTRAQSEETIWMFEIILRSIFIKKWARNIPQ